MSTNNQQDWSKKIEDLKTGIENKNWKDQNWLNPVKTWFLSLPKIAQIIVGISGVFLAISLVNTVFSLVRLLISVAILSLVFYGVYQVLIVPKNRE